jgi:TolA-binding protein
VRAGRKEKAREKLEQLIDAYPATEAAKKARELLIELKK